MDGFVVTDIIILKSKEGLGYLKNDSEYTKELNEARIFSERGVARKYLIRHGYELNKHIILKAKTYYKLVLEDNLIAESV